MWRIEYGESCFQFSTQVSPFSHPLFVSASQKEKRKKLFKFFFLTINVLLLLLSYFLLSFFFSEFTRFVFIRIIRNAAECYNNTWLIIIFNLLFSVACSFPCSFFFLRISSDYLFVLIRSLCVCVCVYVYRKRVYIQAESLCCSNEQLLFHSFSPL